MTQHSKRITGMGYLGMYNINKEGIFVNIHVFGIFGCGWLFDLI